MNDPNRDITVQTVPAAVWRTAVGAPGCDPATNPAYDPARWERFFNLDYATAGGDRATAPRPGCDARRRMGRRQPRAASTATATTPTSTPT